MSKTYHPLVASFLKSTSLKSASAKVYAVNLQKIAELGDFKELLGNGERLLRAVKGRWPLAATQKNKLAAVLRMIRDVPGLKKDYERTYAYLEGVAKQLAPEKNRSGPAAIAWGEVLSVFHRMVASQLEGEVTEDCLLLAMYVCIEPLRQDFGNVRVYRHDEGPPFAGDDYLILGPGDKGVLRLQQNSSSSGRRYERDLPPNLVKIIRLNLKVKPRTHLFEHGGKPYAKRNSFTHFTNRILKKIFFPRKVTVKELRQSFIDSIDRDKASTSQLVDSSRKMAASREASRRMRMGGGSTETAAHPPPLPRFARSLPAGDRPGLGIRPAKNVSIRLQAPENASGIVAMKRRPPVSISI